jgi:hypothetical protein
MSSSIFRPQVLKEKGTISSSNRQQAAVLRSYPSRSTRSYVKYLKEIEQSLRKYCNWTGTLDSAHLDETFETPEWIVETPKEQVVWCNPDIYENKKEKEKGGNKCLVQ